MQPLYNIVSMCGAVLILYFGGRNVLGLGWESWDIAAFATFLSCFGKLALKSSKAAKLFNSVQKAQVSWARIKPLMKEYTQAELPAPADAAKPAELVLSQVSAGWSEGEYILRDISLSATPGQIIGVTGAVACGKSTLGKIFTGEALYTGSVLVDGAELRSLTRAQRSARISYMGHEPELISDTLAENIRLGKPGDLAPVLRAVCLDEEARQMPQGVDTPVGSGGVRLSGGQQARLALARTLYNAQSILVLDDPFSAVDRATEQEIIENLRALCRDKIVLIFSHRLYQFPGFDGVLFLRDGSGVFSCHEKLMQTSPDYARLYLEQVKGGDEHEA